MKFVSILLCCLIILFSFSMSFAEPLSGSFSSQPLIVGSSSDNGSLQFYSSNLIGFYNSHDFCAGTLFPDTYLFYVPSTNFFYFCTLSEFSKPHNFGLGLVDNGSWSSFRYSANVGTFEYNGVLLYYTSSGFQPFSSPNFSLSIPSFNSLDDGLVYLCDYIANVGVQEQTFTSTITVPSGSVAYIGVPKGGTLSMSGSTVMPKYSSLTSGGWSDAPQRVARQSSLPAAGLTFPVSPSSMPNWHKVKPFNILGQSSYAEFSSSDWSFDESGFLTFYNPYFYGLDLTDRRSSRTSDVQLTISGYSSIRIYPLENGFTTSGGSESSSPSDYENYWDGDITDDGSGGGSVTWVPSNDSLQSIPSNNNLNSGGGIASISDYVSQITQTLSNFANSLLSLIQAPISHIQQLISSGSGFMQSLRGLYSWLPADVEGIVISALTIIITIGVFKVFL